MSKNWLAAAVWITFQENRAKILRLFPRTEPHKSHAGFWLVPDRFEKELPAQQLIPGSALDGRFSGATGMMRVLPPKRFVLLQWR